MNSNKIPMGRRPRPATFPIWAFFVLMFVYFEVLLYLLIGISYSGASWLYITLTGSAIGLFVGALISLIRKPKTRKIVGIVIITLSTLLFATEFFLFRAFQTCMTIASIILGAGGVATGFTAIAFGLIFKGFWAIILYFLPLVIFCYFFPRITNDIPRKKSDRGPLNRIGIALFIQLFCLLIIQFSAVDRVKLFKQYDFDSSVHTFGLSNAVGLDFINSLRSDTSIGDFEDITPSDKDKEAVDTDSTTDTDEVIDIPTPPVVYGKNSLDIDFAALAESAKSNEIVKLHSYVASQTPSSKNEFTGLFKGKNLILITAEAFSAEVIDKDRTPTLYRLANKGIKFTDYYQPAWGGSTSTGEYSNIVGLVPMNGVKSIKDTIGKNMYYTMGNQLMRLGYYSLAFHNNSYTYYSRNLTHENLGYSKFIGYGNGIEEGVSKAWPQSDLEMMQYTLDLYADKQPFSIYYMTVSGHCLYNWTGNAMSKKNRAALENVNASETVKAYYAANMELEYGMQYLVSELERRGIADDTVIVISPDHYPYGLEKSEAWGTDKDYLAELYGYPASDIFKRDHSALIIWSGCLEDRDEPIVVDTPTYSLDIVPTLSNLFGTEFDSRLLVGRDVFSDAEPLVLWTNYSWINDKASYDASTGDFIVKPGVEVEDNYLKRIKAIVGNKITFSKSVIAQNYYNVVFGSK